MNKQNRPVPHDDGSLTGFEKVFFVGAIIIGIALMIVMLISYLKMP